MLKNYAIILASGAGIRFDNDLPKQFIKIAGKTVLEHSVEIFEHNSLIDEIIIVITPEYRTLTEEIILKNNWTKVSKLLNGGSTRKESSYIGINSIKDKEANVIIHDCARPFLNQKIISDCISALYEYSAVDVAIKASDTIIKVQDNIIDAVPHRNNLMRGQTPQCFKLSAIKKAHELSKDDNNFTDDCGLVLKHKLCPVFVVEGEIENIKITYPLDIYIADKLFQLKKSTLPEDIPLENLRNKDIVIFGGSSGIGRCISEIAQKNGANVFITSLSKGCDISQFGQVEKFLEKVYCRTKNIDCVINTAGVLKLGKLADRSVSDIRKEFEVNYLGSIHVAKASIPYLKESAGALLLFASSSYTRGRALYSTYSSAKACIVNLVQALSEELINDKIRVNVINPARTNTPMRYKVFGKEPEKTLLNPVIVAKKSLKVLLSDITGQVIDVRNNDD